MTKGRYGYRFVGVSGRAPAACAMATYRPEYESSDDMYVPYGSGASTAARIVSDALHSSDDLYNKSRRKDDRLMREVNERLLESSTLPRPVSTIRRTTRGTSLPPRPVGRKPLTCVAPKRLVSNTSDIIAESDVYLESSPPRVTAPARKPPNHRVKIRMTRAASVPPRPMKENQVKQAAMKGRFRQPKAKPTKALKGRPNDYILEKLMTRSNDEFQLESRPTASRTYESKPARPFTSFPVNKIPAPRVEVNNYEYQRLMRPENRYVINEEPNLPLPSTYSRMRDSVRGLHDKMDQHRLMLDRYIVTDLKPDPLDTRSRVEARSEQLLRSAHLRSPRGHRAASAEPYNSSSSRPMSEVRSHIRDVICRTRKDPLYYQ